MKVVVVGGGSTYTPELVSGHRRAHRVTCRSASWCCSTRTPTGSPSSAPSPSGSWTTATGPARLTLTGDRSAALDGADAVLIQLRVGGQEARLHDETVPLRCGCLGQETTGAGGLAKALRTVPVVLDLAAEVERRAAPGAWIVDFANPVGIVTRALRDAGHRAIGLCNVAIGLQRFTAGLLGVEPGQVMVDQVGLNHLTWIRRVVVDGEDRLPELLDRHLDACAEQLDLPADLIRELGALPSYYLRYFYFHDQVVDELRTEEPQSPGGATDREGAARPLPRPRAGREAGAAGAARRRLLQRGGGGPADVAGHRRRRGARGRRAQRRARWPAWPTTTWSRCRPGSTGTARTRCRRRRSRPSCSAWCSTSRRTSGWPSGPP